MSTEQPAIWWIRRDLRLTDNPTLAAASAGNRPVIPLFIRDPVLENSPYVGPRRLDFLHGALHDLATALSARGGQLIVRQGKPAQLLPTILAASGAQKVYAEADYSPYARHRDKAVAELLPLELIEGVAIRPVGQVLKTDGDPYTVFTPFSKRWKGLPPPATSQLLASPGQLQTPDLDTEPLPEISQEQTGFPPTGAEAQRRLKEFRQNGIFAYKAQRDFLAVDGTSALSPYLRFGLLSARQAAVVALEAINTAPDKATRQGAESWLNELLWREFYINILYHFPEARRGSFRPAYDNVAWRNDKDEFQAWCTGQTGYPIVDAGMRQLNQTGWMHNRARMIVASFLVKDLLINWQWGEHYFMQQLLDGDPAANNGGWQWTAGTGTDAAPYFRIFNPVSQGQRYDPAGAYVRRWVPELATLPDKFIHEPWALTPLEQRSYNCRLGEDYPEPIVDHKVARERTLAAYKAAREE